MAKMTLLPFNETIIADGSGDLNSADPEGMGNFLNGDTITINAGTSVNFGTGPIVTGITGFGTGLMESQALGSVLPASYNDIYSSPWFTEYQDVNRRSIAEEDGLRTQKSVLGRDEMWDGGGMTGYDLGAPIVAGDKVMVSSWAKAINNGINTDTQWKSYRIQNTGSGIDLGDPDSIYSKLFSAQGSQTTIYAPTAVTYFERQNELHPIFDSIWTRHDMFYIYGTEDAADGTVYGRGIKQGTTGMLKSFMGKSAGNITGDGDLPLNTSGNPNWRFLMNEEFVNNNFPSSYIESVDIHRRECYFQKGWSRVELANTDVRSTMEIPEIQPYLTWADGQITLSLWKGFMNDVAGFKLVIYDDNDNIIASAPLNSTTVTAELVV